MIDGDGVIRWSYVSPLGVNPGADGILEALEAMAEPRPPHERNMSSPRLTVPVSERDHVQGSPRRRR